VAKKICQSTIANQIRGSFNRPEVIHEVIHGVEIEKRVAAFGMMQDDGALPCQQLELLLSLNCEWKTAPSFHYCIALK
jgi:hypothetical protein